MKTEEQVKASPTKAFFVQMLVKDVALESAILDLVDNCIDGAINLRGDGSYTGLWAKVTANRDEFVIDDNCGGIDIDTAKNYAFRFGRDPKLPTTPKSLGVFGVGMKRAIFKIGRDVYIRSTTKTHSFKISLNVPDWQKLEEPTGEWHFPMEVEKLSHEPPQDQQGTIIKISNLYDTVKKEFESDYFVIITRAIGSRHQTYIDRGIAIQVNGVSVPGAVVEFAYLPNKLVPAFEERSLDGVAMNLYAGVGELNRIQAGWYIYCNGRMIIEHDKTELTGWGESVETAIPKYHHQFARFRGCVYFDSKDSKKLPWNTTKDGVDVTSDVYRTAKTRMVTHMRTVINFLNKVDKEYDEPDESKRVLMNLLDKALYAPPLSVPKASKFTYTAVLERLPEYTRVYIWRPKEAVERLKKCLRAKSNKEALENIFDWYLENECGDVE
jgi:hypothetical protein